MAFPLRAERPIKRIGEQLLNHLREDSRIEARPAPEVHVSKVIDIFDALRPIVELTVSAKTRPADADAVKQRLMGLVTAMLTDSGTARPKPSQAAGVGNVDDPAGLSEADLHWISPWAPTPDRLR